VISKERGLKIKSEKKKFGAYIGECAPLGEDVKQYLTDTHCVSNDVEADEVGNYEIECYEEKSCRAEEKNYQKAFRSSGQSVPTNSTSSDTPTPPQRAPSVSLAYRTP